MDDILGWLGLDVCGGSCAVDCLARGCLVLGFFLFDTAVGSGSSAGYVTGGGLIGFGEVLNGEKGPVHLMTVVGCTVAHVWWSIMGFW